MPDLKFKGGKFYFSILNPDGGKWPILLPRISNPNFMDSSGKITSAIGLVELLNGDLGITERIMMPILKPILASVTANPLVAEFIANKPLEVINSGTIENTKRLTGKAASDKAAEIMLKNYIPKDSGLKSIEKTIITSMMESHKPLMDFMKIFIEMLGIAEDVVCRFLGTSIKIAGKQIGFPSRNPKHWNESLGYAKTMSFSKKEFDEAVSKGLKEYEKNMANGHPLKENVSGGNETGQVDIQGDDKEALYVGFFDEDGVEVDPPAWVKNSNKWFSKDFTDINGNQVRIGAPFKRLSPILEEGIAQLRVSHDKSVDRLKKQKIELLQSLSQRAIDIEREFIEKENILKSQNLPKDQLAEEMKEIIERRKIDIEVLETEKIDAEKTFDDLINSIEDVLEGTNKAGNNLINDEDPNEGINSPGLLNEWIAKVRGSQLRTKYFPETESTIQSLVDKKGDPKEPYVGIAKFKTVYQGRNVEIEVPMAYKKQIAKEEFKDDELFFEKKLTKEDINPLKRYKYSMRNVVNNLDVHFNTDPIKPYQEDKLTHFTHNPKNEYIPDPPKNYILPIEWEEVFEYEIRNKDTGQLIRTETEVVPHSIDIEKDYELRVIKVINIPLPNGNVDVDAIYDSETIPAADPNTGTIYFNGNNIPQALKQGEDGRSVDGNLHSTPDINEQNLLKEGIIYQGLDPRFIDRTKYKVFFLIEALKKDDTGVAPINKKYNPFELAQIEEDKKAIDKDEQTGGKGGKVWYGLIDKFTALPVLISKLVPLIATKLIPLIIKIIQIVSNPSKIKNLLLDLVLDKSISKFPVNFPAFDKEKGAIGKVQALEKKGVKPQENFNAPKVAPQSSMYYAGVQHGVKNPRIASMIDGQAVADFGRGAFKKPLFSFGVEVGANNSNPFKIITKKKPRKSMEKAPEVKDQPIIELILNFIKMPFEIIFMIFKWIINWIKKLLNPVKIPAAIIEFITFKWLKDIIGKKGLFTILGMVDPSEEGKIKDLIDKMSEFNGDNAQELIDRVVKSLENGSDDIIEVLIYNLYRNGVLIGQETEERPYTGDGSISGNGNGNGNGNNDGSGLNNGNGINDGVNDGINDDSSDGVNDIRKTPLAFCGPRNFSLNDLLPIPFLSQMPKFNVCEMPLVFLKPLEMVLGILKTVQEILNALISMPMSILGLDPQIPIPKFGKEIPFADVFEKLIEKLRDKLTQKLPKSN